MQARECDVSVKSAAAFAPEDTSDVFVGSNQKERIDMPRMSAYVNVASFARPTLVEGLLNVT